MVIILGMKTIFFKIQIHPLTYFLFLTFLITGHFKNILLIFLIVFMHEMGHVFFLKMFHYPIESIEFLPFGGITKTTKFINTPIKHDLIIYLGGVFFQLLLFFIFFFLFQNFYINEMTYNLFLKYNFSILIFNILPIRPLDGGEILHLFFENYFPYTTAMKISNLLSLIFLILFFIINIQFNLNNYCIISFLFVKIYALIKNEKFYKNKFLLERLMYQFPYFKIHNESQKNIFLLKKETYHFFKEGNHYISEKELLKRKFDNPMYF